MPTYKIELNQNEIREAIATAYRCRVENVTLTIEPPYNGGPGDRSPGGVTATLSVQGPASGKLRGR